MMRPDRPRKTADTLLAAALLALALLAALAFWRAYRVVAGVLQRRVMPPEAVGDLWADIGAPQWEPYPLPPSAMPDGPVRDYYEWVTR